MGLGRGNQLIFGQIQLSSEVESMDSLLKTLKEILDTQGYPSGSGVVTTKDQQQKKEKAEKSLKQEQEKLQSMLKDGSEEELFGDGVESGDGTDTSN